jgi:hypothetical protein
MFRLARHWLVSLGLVLLVGCGGSGGSKPTAAEPPESTGGTLNGVAGGASLTGGTNQAQGGSGVGIGIGGATAAGGTTDTSISGTSIEDASAGSTLGGATSLGGMATSLGGMATSLGSGGAVANPTVKVVPDQPAMVQLPNQIEVSVPAGAVTVPGTLSVERWDFPPSGGTNVGIGASSYIIGLNDGLGGQALSKPATITFHFDPAQLRKDVAASEAVWVVYWDSAKRRLVEEPCTVDATNGTVTVSTNHFSQWWLYLLGPGDAYGTSPHFTFRFPAAINISAWGTNDPFEVMARVRSKLEAFHDAYVAAGFGAPSWKVPVYLSESDEAGYGPLTGNVCLTSRIYSSDMNVFEHELAHELFHAFQGAKLNVFSLDQRRWFVEAAADYAADALATHSGLMGKDIAATWATLPIDTIDGKHEYATSHFLRWLVAQGKMVAALQDAVFGAWVTDQGKSAFAAAATLKGSFAQTFVEYLVWLETAADSPLAKTPLGGQVIAPGFSLDQQLDLPIHFRPAVLAYQANLPPEQQRLLSWTLPNGVVSAVRILRGGLRGNPEIPTESSTMFSNGDLVLLIVNVDQAQLVTLHVELEPDPAPFYLGPTDIVSALLPNTDSTASYVAYETIYVPWPVEVLSVNSTTCKQSLSGRSPLMCWAWVIRARSRLPGKSLNCRLRLGGGAAPGNGSTTGTPWEVTQLPQVSSTGTAFSLPALPDDVPIPVTGGSTSLWAPIRVSQYPFNLPVVSDEVTAAEVQIEVEAVPFDN